jgi:hypothetical protein
VIPLESKFHTVFSKSLTKFINSHDLFLALPFEFPTGNTYLLSHIFIGEFGNTYLLSHIFIGECGNTYLLSHIFIGECCDWQKDPVSLQHE